MFLFSNTSTTLNILAQEDQCHIWHYHYLKYSHLHLLIKDIIISCTTFHHLRHKACSYDLTLAVKFLRLAEWTMELLVVRKTQNTIFCKGYVIYLFINGCTKFVERVSSLVISSFSAMKEIIKNCINPDHIIKSYLYIL